MVSENFQFLLLSKVMTFLVKRMHVLSTLKVELRVKNKPDNELKFPVTILKHSENIHFTGVCVKCPT